MKRLVNCPREVSKRCLDFVGVFELGDDGIKDFSNIFFFSMVPIWVKVEEGCACVVNESKESEGDENDYYVY